MNNTLAGGVAGLMATLPMTVAMELMHNQLPLFEKYALPPRQITDNVLEEAGIDDELSEDEHRAATVAAHFGYGTACGALYSAVSDRLPGSPAAKGIAFGLAVWTGSYLGLLPATGLLSSAKYHPKRRNALMIAAHVVWGASTGILAHAMADDES